MLRAVGSAHVCDEMDESIRLTGRFYKYCLSRSKASEWLHTVSGCSLTLLSDQRQVNPKLKLKKRWNPLIIKAILKYLIHNTFMKRHILHTLKNIAKYIFLNPKYWP